jgi:bifunctional ADP-heptose synthase (sugar kinase/adenylyltransferase)
MNRYSEIINKFNSVKVLVIGDIMLDIYEFCLSSMSKELLSEKPGKMAYNINKSIKVLGGAGNVASNLTSLGATTSIVSITGNDEYYFKIRELCEKIGVNHYLIRDPLRPTTKKTRIFLDDEYFLRRDDESIKKIDKETSGTLVNSCCNFK